MMKKKKKIFSSKGAALSRVAPLWKIIVAAAAASP